MQVQKENIDVLEPDAWHLFVTASSSMQSIWAACRPSWGIIAGMMLWNCAAPTESYFPLSVLLHWRSISSIWRFTGALSTSVNGLLNSSNLNFWAAKEENRCVNSIPSAPSLSANCAVGRAVETYLISVWQHRKWLKFPCCIWVSHRGSFAWKALTAS